MLLYYIYPSEIKYFMLEKGISDTFVADDHSSPTYRLHTIEVGVSLSGLDEVITCAPPFLYYLTIA